MESIQNPKHSRILYILIKIIIKYIQYEFTIAFKRNKKTHHLINGSQLKCISIGSAFSIGDILAVLYDDILKVDSTNPNLLERDKLILTKLLHVFQ